MLVRGFHGTRRAIAEQLVSGALDWRPSTNDGDWLGFGSYFFQDGFERARFWAEQTCPSGEEPAVIEAEIDLTDTLDLLDLKDWETVRYYAHQAVRAGLAVPDQEEFVVAKGRCKPPPRGKTLQMRNVQDRFLIDFCVAQLSLSRPITCVRSSFIWGSAVTRKSALFNWSRVEIAVRDPKAAIKSQRIVL